MFGFDNDHKQVYGDNEHKGPFTHEAIAGAASWEAMKLFENHQRKEGQSVSHDFAKKLIAGFVGGEVDKLIETKGLNWLDAEKAKRDATQNAEKVYDQHYGGTQEWSPDQPKPPNM